MVKIYNSAGRAAMSLISKSARVLANHSTAFQGPALNHGASLWL
jgi:hypothetical protein